MIVYGYVANNLRNVSEIQYLHKSSAPSFGSRNYQRPSGCDYPKADSLVSRRTIPQILSEERPQAGPKKEKVKLALRAYYVYDYSQIHRRCF